MRTFKSARIINFGSINIDHVYSTQQFVSPGETIAVEDYAIFAGGKGLNQSIAIARAGSSVQHVGNIGADGDWLLKLLQDEGIDTSLVGRPDQPTGHAIIEIDGQGENRIGSDGSQQRALAGHIGAGDDEDPLALAEANVVAHAAVVRQERVA